MTIPPPSVPPSRTSVRIEAIADTMLMKLAGVVVFGLFTFFEYQEVVVPPMHTVHILIFIGGMVVGLAMLFGKLFVNMLASLLAVAGPYLPKFGKKDGDT